MIIVVNNPIARNISTRMKKNLVKNETSNCKLERYLCTQNLLFFSANHSSSSSEGAIFIAGSKITCKDE